jgi:predicted amidohydrolase YtcJ
MTRKILLVGMVLLLAGIALAKEGKSVKLTGYIIDNACAAGRATGDNATDKVKDHSVKCAMMPKCAESGYAVFADNKLYKLDKAGNKKAAEILKNTKAEKGVQVSVEGTVDGDTLTVTSISEVVSS